VWPDLCSQIAVDTPHIPAPITIIGVSFIRLPICPTYS
jgi:hypothetical protein